MGLTTISQSGDGKGLNLPETGHDPVLVKEIGEALPLSEGSVYMDCTLGRGGHALAYGPRLGTGGLLIGLDADERNLTFAAERLKGLPCRKRFFHANFSDLTEVLKEAGVKEVHSILADLGVSTNQLFDPHYGMSMTVSGELDMRLDKSRGVSAADIVNRWPEEKIADVLYFHADERLSRRIARKIAAERKASPILTTERLAEVVRSSVPRGNPGDIDPATRTFQALRMEANGEVPNLERLLQQAPQVLATGGRLAVISFHSGEDRRVKQAFKHAETTERFRVIGKKPISPMDAEVHANPRSRSAKLRVLERL